MRFGLLSIIVCFSIVQITAQCDITSINYIMPTCNIAGETITITWTDNCPDSLIRITLDDLDQNIIVQSAIGIANTQSYDFNVNSSLASANYRFYIEYHPSQIDWLHGPASYQNNDPEISVLENFYQDFQGSSWTNNTGWLSDCDPCGIVSGMPWQGIQCNVSGNVTQIALSNNNLVGALTPDNLSSSRDNLCDLSALESLDLSDNNISGELSECLFTATRDLLLNDNNISGELPTSFANLSSSAIIHLENNNLDGCYPNPVNPVCTAGYTNAQISDGNDFDAQWEDYCSTGLGVCCTTVYDLNLSSTPNGDYYSSREIKLSGVAPASADLVFHAPQVTSNMSSGGATNLGTLEVDPNGCDDENSLFFDGDNDLITVGPCNLANDFSISFWFRTDNFTSPAETRFFTANDGSSVIELGIHNVSSHPLWIFDNENSINVSVGPNLVDGVWHHIAYTASSTQRNIYLDGAQVYSYSASHKVYDNYFRLGQWVGGLGITNFHGEIDEFRHYNVTLDLEDFENEYQCGLYENENHLEIYFNFNEGTSYEDNTSLDTIFNQVSNSYHAKIYNMSLVDTVGNFVDPLEITVQPCCSAGFTLNCQSVGAGLIPVDTNNDSVPDDEQVTLDASLFDAGSTLNCGDSYLVAYDALGTITQMTFDCDDIGTQFIDIFFISDTGIVAQCSQTAVMIVDNNGVDICP